MSSVSQQGKLRQGAVWLGAWVLVSSATGLEPWLCHVLAPWPGVSCGVMVMSTAQLPCRGRRDREADTPSLAQPGFRQHPVHVLATFWRGAGGSRSGYASNPRSLPKCVKADPGH